MDIAVIAYATRTSGGLTIYRQFVNHLRENIGDNKWHIYIDKSMDHPNLGENVNYIFIDDHSWIGRIKMDNGGVLKELSSKNLQIDILVSLQNTGIKTNLPQIIYYHQSLPLYNRRFSLFKKDERKLFLITKFYPFFVKRTLNHRTHVVVQIPFIKRMFISKFRMSSNRVHVLFPDVEKIDANSIIPHDFSNDCYNFIYPAKPSCYKEHRTLIKSMAILNGQRNELAKKIKIWFTFTEEQSPEMVDLMNNLGVRSIFVFMKPIPHDELLSYYKSSKALLFPSTLETIGMPLLEASAFGLPIIASDVEYVHEVLCEYDGVNYVSPYDYEGWSTAIIDACENNRFFQPIKEKSSSWGGFFDLIKEFAPK